MNDASLPAAPARPLPPGDARPHEREVFAGFVRDDQTLQAIRTAFAPAFPAGVPLHRLSYAETLSSLAAMQTPQTILVDISGEEQPLNAMHQLEAVVDPGSRVLIIGEERSVGFYRSLVRTLGVSEYLPKPIDPATAVRELLPWARGTTPVVEPARGGTIIAVCGAVGGVGVTTIATGLAWLTGGETRRHAILLDADLQRGSAALAVNVVPSTGLRLALDAPDRIDPLLIERAAQPSVGRLHVLAAEEPLTEAWDYRAGGARALVAALRQRYNFIIADIPARPLGFAAELLSLAHERVIVTSPAPHSLAGARRWLDLPSGPLQGRAAHVVLNRHQRRRSLSPDRIARALGSEIAAVIAEQGSVVRRGNDLGEPVVSGKGAFRNAMLALANRLGTTAGAVPS